MKANSTRAIARKRGVSQSTVSRDLRSGESGSGKSDGWVRRVTGLDGKTYTRLDPEQRQIAREYARDFRANGLSVRQIHAQLGGLVSVGWIHRVVKDVQVSQDRTAENRVEEAPGPPIAPATS